MKKVSIAGLVLAFLVSGVPVYAWQVVESSGSVEVVDSQSSLVSKLAAKKKLDCKKKKNKKKKECKKTKSHSEVNQDPSTYKDANYTGPFPAPEGMVLEGTSGEDQFKDPAGNGAYRFKIQTAWKNHIACLDSTRTLIGSKGKTFEAGWFKGYGIGKLEGEKLVAYYDETPQGSGAGGDLYDEGYRLGYNRGFSGMSIFNAQYPCTGHNVDLSNYDEDGWSKVKVAKIPALKVLYLPTGYAAETTGTSLLGNDGVYISFDDVTNGQLNGSEKKLNFTRMDLLESTLDATEQKMSVSELAQGSYDVMTAAAGKKYKNVCVFDEPLIEEKTYGNNTFVNLNWVTVCNTGADGGPSWMLNVYSFKKLANDKMLVVQLFSPQSVKASGKNELDTSKFPSADFIDQLYSKMQF